MNYGMPWHTMSAGESAKFLKSHPERGLATPEAERRYREHGPNRLREAKKTSPVAMFISQFKDFMVILLLAATLVSTLMGEKHDAITIMAIVVMNAILGFVQEFRAERSMDALKRLTAQSARVIRDGYERSVAAEELVQGDVVIIEAGDKVPADLRLIRAFGMELDESALTGESLPTGKTAELRCKPDCQLADMKNMLFSGTNVVSGRGMGIVVASGMDTEIGRIAGMIQDSGDDPTPLQIRLAQLGRWLLVICLALCAVVTLAGILQGSPPFTMFLSGVSLAVAAIPEGLPAIVTICLALGMQRMSKRNAIVRRLASVETLGCADIICSDKTGTLTQNQMTVRRITFYDGDLEVTGGAFDPRGRIYSGSREVVVERDGGLDLTLRISLLCNNASLGIGRGEEFKESKVARDSMSGDPTELALLMVGLKSGVYKDKLEERYPTLTQIPFDSTRKMMSVICGDGDRHTLLCKGAPERILAMCTKIYTRKGITPLTDTMRRRLLRKNEEMAEDALRVLALAYRELQVGYDRSEKVSDSSKHDKEGFFEIERELIFVSFVGMADPPRPEVKSAVGRAKDAGVRTIMITGDHKATAAAIAKQIGIECGNGRIMVGDEMDRLGDPGLSKAVENVNVFARVSPRHKLRIVKALKKNGHTVAMTGDGVNDAPAVKEADIGIAMGESGTDVTREASAMILADDNYATIVAAIEEGRGIYNNILNFIRYLLACNVGEVVTMLFAAFCGMQLPLLPIQILWMNLVTDGLPAIALSVDPMDPDVMKRPPRRSNEGIFARNLHMKIVVQGLFIALCTLSIYSIELFVKGSPLIKARTMAFTTLVLSQLIYVFYCRSERGSANGAAAGKSGRNPLLVLAVTLSLIMQLFVIYNTKAQGVFNTVSLGINDWIPVIIFSAISAMLSSAAKGLKTSLFKRITFLKVR